MALYTALVRAVETYRHAEIWRQLVRRCMTADFSWDRSAERYVDLYFRALAVKRQAQRTLSDYALARSRMTDHVHRASLHPGSLFARVRGACRRATDQRGKPAVALDRTAFYPTGGGQPNDRGTLDGVPVLDVIVEDGLVWHVLAAELPGSECAGILDWARRFDHMQQHTGQHILSEAFIVTCDAHTVAFHLGADACTIDLDRADLGPTRWRRRRPRPTRSSSGAAR